jgi:hypothetical protein
MGEDLILWVYEPGAPAAAFTVQELVRMTREAQTLSEAALVKKDPKAVQAGEFVFQSALARGPQRARARLAAHLLRVIMTHIDEKPVVPTSAAVVQETAPASPPKVRTYCTAGHFDDETCQLCEPKAAGAPAQSAGGA